MPAVLLQCTVCQEPGRSFRHFTEPGLVKVVECLGFQVIINKHRFICVFHYHSYYFSSQADDNFCDSCYYMVVERHKAIIACPDVSRTPSLETQDVSSELLTQPSQPQVTRYSEMPLPFSPPRSTPSSSGSLQTSTHLDDTVDRLVKKKPRVSKATVNAIASQSLSVENVSSQELSTATVRRMSSRQNSQGE